MSYRIKPYKGTSQDRLTQLVRQAQTPDLPGSINIFYAPPQPASSGEPGATVVMGMATGPGRTDPAVLLKYKRLDLEVLQRLPEGELIPFPNIHFPTSVHAALPQINEALGLNLVPAEVVNDTWSGIPDGGITLTITNASLAWLPGIYVFIFTPGAHTPAARAEEGQIPTDERGRIRLRETPSTP